MRDLTLAINQAAANTRKKSNPAAVLRWNLAILFSIMALGLTYLLQINALGTKGYQIRDLQQKITQQETAQKQLEIQSSGLKSITRIQTQAQAMNFVPATGVSYIKDGDFALNQ